MILGTAGHIDHGKTTLVRALTGVDTDRLPEEKRRGITIELGFAPLEIDGVGIVGVVDVPGHEAFVRAMVAGATGIDLALLVVAADEGVMPQTREHLAILELLGVRRGVIALTKADLVDEDWLALVEEDVRAASNRALPEAKIVATSSVTGSGVAELRAEIAAIARSLPGRAGNDLFRMPIDRSFTIRGTGTVVTGTVWSGRLERDDVVRIVSSHTLTVREARVRGVQTHGAQVDAAVAGVRTAIALAGVDLADAPRGATLVTDREWGPTSVLRADVSLVAGSDVEIRPRTWLRFHTGTSEVGARVVARDVRGDAPFAARIVLDQPVLVRAGDRFVIRTSAPLNTIAGGVVVDPHPTRRGRLWPPSLDSAARLDRLVDEAGAEGVAVSSLPIRLGLPMADCRRQVDLSDCVGVGPLRVVASTALTRLREAIAAAVDAHHAAYPLDPGLPVQAIRGAVKGHPDVVEAAINAEISAGGLALAAGTASRPGWAPTPSPRHRSMLETLVSQLDGSGAEPPSVAELSVSIGGDAGELLRYLERRGEAVQVEQDRYYAPIHLTSLVGRLEALLAGGAALGPAELREGLGLSRKYLIPFLEYCDRVGYTNRVAAGRVWVGT